MLTGKPFPAVMLMVCLVFLASTGAQAGEAGAGLATHPKLRGASGAAATLGAGAAEGRFIVMLKTPKTAGPDPDLATEPGRAEARARTAAVLDAFLNRKEAAATGTITRRFDYMPAFAATLTGERLAALLEADEVEFIEEDMVLRPHLRQGVPLEAALVTRSRFSGAGVSVAVCDTGVDYNNINLGGGAIPNGVVIGGANTATSSETPMDTNGHGTACAGIVAGTIGDTADYIGGVAPGAKIYALKIVDADGLASDASLAAAWEWSITNKNASPQHPILIISTSFGGGYNTAVCDATRGTLATAATNAVNAGITLFASSGNDGYCEGLSSPGCLSKVISVGAVYDGDFGQSGACIKFESCAPGKYWEQGCLPFSEWYAQDASAADRVTSYSNSASFLTLFAPADKCNTLQCAAKGSVYNLSFGGTSAACPYAAGAAAALQSAAKSLTGSYLTPAQVKSILVSTGASVTDPKVAVTKPRVNLLAAINSLRKTVNLLPLDIPAAIKVKPKAE